MNISIVFDWLFQEPLLNLIAAQLEINVESESIANPPESIVDPPESIDFIEGAPPQGKKYLK